MDLASWALRTSSNFTTEVKYSSIRVFDQIRNPEIPITLRPSNFFTKDIIPEYVCELNANKAEAQGG